MPTIEQLAMWQAVVEQGSISAGAERVHKTQPALSHALKQLEASLGVSLFDRRGYRLALTEPGRVLYQLAQQVLTSHAALQETAKHFSEGFEAQVVLAIEASFAIETITPALKRTQQVFPKTNIVLQQEYLTGAYEALQQGVAQLAITPMPENLVKPSQLTVVKIASGRLINVMAPEMAQRHAPIASVKQLVDEYQIVVKDSGGMTQGVNLDVQPAQRYWYVNNFATKLSLIQQGMGWGKLPQTMVADELRCQTLVHVPISDFAGISEFDYKLVKHHDQVLGPVGQMLWDEITQVAKIG